MLTLLERGSRWLRLVVASRTRPGWPLAALKTRGMLHEVTASDLVLSLSESAQILGDGLDRAALAIVHSRTEGWAVAVQLARLWLAGGSGTSSGLQAFDGRVADVAEYLAEQVIETLPPECREFLLETSPLDRFNAELAIELLRLAEVAVQGAPSLRRDLRIISALVHVYFDRLDAMAQWPADGAAANQALPDDPLGQATVLCASAVAALAWGRMDEVSRAASDAHTRMRLVGSPLGENYCLLHIAQASSITGQIAAARQRIDEAVALAEANFGTDSSLKALVGCFKAQHLYWQGQWAEARPWLLAGQETLAHVDGWLDVFAATAEVSWRITLRHDGLQQAWGVLDATAQLARSRALARLARLVAAWRVDLLAQCGLLAQAQQEAQAALLEPQLGDSLRSASGRGMDWRFIEAATLALARLQITAGAAQAAQSRLVLAARLFDSAGLLLPCWRLRLMALLAQRRAQDGALAAAEIQTVLAPISRHGLAGLLLEAGPPALALLLQLEGSLPPPMMAVLTQLRGWQSHPPRHRPQLSGKETEVLQLLVAGQPNKTIARALDISENTVKFHLKQVFQKLAVDNRSAAIAAALRQGFVTALPAP